MPINPPRETPPAEKAAKRVAATSRTYSPLIAVGLAVVGASMPADLTVVGILLVALAAAIGMKGSR